MDDLQKYALEQPPGVHAFFALVETTADLIAASERYWQSHDLNGARIRILVEIAKAGGSLLPSALAERIGVTKANISVLLVPLASEDLVRIDDDPNDGRKRRVTLAAAGERLLRDKLPGNREVIGRRMDRLSEAETRQLLDLLAKLRE
ncbi:MarR family winged helix-turn-helix transcriptional regulator [Cohnella sp. GCM10020058]|uniref:MarR family winged helix-turn-helix transcriptional regulator n=1 Tax=Cohnella sp. GCM10020058 TaxID=3317330 RepID=UPI0036394EB0